MSQENVDVVRGMYGAWNRGDYEAAEQAFDAEVEIELRLGTEMDRTYRGRDEFVKNLRSFWGTFSDVGSEPAHFATSGDEVLATVRHHGRGRGSGAEVRMTSWQVFTVRGGRIVRFRDFHSRDEAFEAAGLSE